MNISIRNVDFEVLGPVDRRLSAPVSPRGRLGCPVCATSSINRHVGVFWVNQHYFEHLKQDHYRCECGWVGVKPGQHVTRSPNHEGPVPTERERPGPIRISDLSGRLGQRVIPTSERRRR